MAEFSRTGKKMQIRIILITLLFSISLSNCASYDFSRRVVQQGNLLPQSKIDRLKIGMSKEDAAILIGTSLLSPLFTNDRWDYAYTWRKGSGPVAIKNVTLYFSNGRLIRIEKMP